MGVCFGVDCRFESAQYCCLTCTGLLVAIIRRKASNLDRPDEEDVFENEDDEAQE